MLTDDFVPLRRQVPEVSNSAAYDESRVHCAHAQFTPGCGGKANPRRACAGGLRHFVSVCV